MIDHGSGIVIGETAEIGDDVLLYQGVTLGGTGKDKGKRHPTLGNNVMVGAGARILGPFRVGDNARIASNAVVLREVPPASTADGVPGQIVKIAGERINFAAEVDQIHVEDPVQRGTETIDRKNRRTGKQSSGEQPCIEVSQWKGRSDMKIYNSMTRQKEEFQPLVPERSRCMCAARQFNNYIHVGNARPIIVFEGFRRNRIYRGDRVTYGHNFTDIDDKVIKKANEEGVDYSEIASRYIEEYRTDAHGLGVLDADIHPLATENMDEIIALIGKLVDKGYAYPLNGDVYYRTEKFGEYGKLSHQPLEDLLAGARIEVKGEKESPMDFALWKGAKPGEPSWDSPWGPGRPGWHIECSAMSGRYLGKTIDIHGGGQDLIFPHHENEIAQSEAANGQTFVRYWMHNAFLDIDNRKMSKSLGNFFTVREAAETYGYEPIRFFMLSAHYRSPLNYSRESLEQAQAALSRLYTAVSNLEFLAEHAEDRGLNSDVTDFVAGFRDYRERFIAAMEDDFNTADAIGVLFELVRAVNAATAPENRPGRLLAQQCLKMVREITDVLGLLYARREENLDREIEDLIKVRQEPGKTRILRKPTGSAIC